MSNHISFLWIYIISARVSFAYKSIVYSTVCLLLFPYKSIAYMYYCLQLDCLIYELLRTIKNFRNEVTLQTSWNSLHLKRYNWNVITERLVYYVLYIDHLQCGNSNWHDNRRSSPLISKNDKYELIMIQYARIVLFWLMLFL